MTAPDTFAPRRLLSLIAMIMASVTLAACGQTANDTRSATAGLPDLEQSLMAHEWLLDLTDSSLPSAGTNRVTLIVTSGTSAWGTASCNTYRARFILNHPGESGGSIS